MTPQDQILLNIERVGTIVNWSGWQIRFVQAGATLLGRDYPGLSDPNVTDAELIDLADGLGRGLLDGSTLNGAESPDITSLALPLVSAKNQYPA